MKNESTPSPEEKRLSARSFIGAIKKGARIVRGRTAPTAEGAENIRADARREEPIESPAGLTSAQVEELTRQGRTNAVKKGGGKSYFKIITDNLFTFFNLIWAVIAAVLVLFESYESLTFLVVVLLNLGVAIFQESRAKYAVNRLSLASDSKASAVRDGELVAISASAIVEGEVVKIEMGRQVPCDGTVLAGLCEANESMLTGESVPIKKEKGDSVLAGSFLVSGCVYVRCDKVGKDNYIHTLEKEAKSFKAPASNLFRDLNKLIKTIGGFLLPLAVLMLISNWLFYKKDFEGFELFKTVVEKTCGSIVGMIPAGIYLLVTVTLSLSVLTLSKKKTLVQDMYSIEMLASADVLCLDKTGTITDGTMRVCTVESLDGSSEEEIGRIMSYVEGAESGVNATTRALITHFGKSSATVLDSIPFSSQRKYSGVELEGIGSFCVGAPCFVPCPVSEELQRRIDEHAREGRRVLLLVSLKSLRGDSEGRAVAIISIEDRIRPAARETIAGFQEQGVTVKVISGDHAATVSTIAGKVGINNYDKYISCEHLNDEDLEAMAEEYTVFGRVTPEQKVLLVKTLQKKGHTVAMTGDGVNDTLALRESNCAIAMADGSEVARKISQIVLLESDFSTLPAVVKEGRRCINNVRQSSVLFLMKTIFTIFVSLFSIVTVSGYPFGPNNFLFLELFVIGVASLLLALEPNEKRIEGSFLDSVIVKSAPCALALFVPTLVIQLIGRFSNSVSVDCRNAVAMCAVTLVGFLNLVYICRPYTKWRGAVVGLIATLLGAGITVSVLAESFFVKNGIFGFIHAMDNFRFFAFMMALSVIVTVLLQFFRTQLEKWASELRKTDLRIRKRGKEKGEE